MQTSSSPHETFDALERISIIASERTNALLCAAMDEMPEGVVLLDREGRYIHWNRSYAEIYKKTADLFAVGARFADTLRIGLQRGDYPEAIGREETWYAERMRRLADPGERHEQQLSDGRWILIEERRLPDGSTIGLRIDITEMKQRESSFRLLFESNPIPMYVLDRASQRFLAVNDAAVAHYGYAREHFLLMSRRDLLCSDEGAPEIDADAVKTSEQHLRADGSIIDVAAFSNLTVYGGAPAALIAAVDVTERNRSEARIAHMARHDSLTGLPNRTFLRERLDALLAGRQAFSIFLVDLDHFKAVNDTLGHSAGDRLLEDVAKRLLAIMGEPSTVARLGGDEFAILYLGAQDEAAVRRAAGAVIEAVTPPVAIGGTFVQVAASVGVSRAAIDSNDPETLMRRADVALYQAKAAGRHTYRLFEPAMDDELTARVSFESDLREAVRMGALNVEYQPIVDLATGAPTCMEALLRWTHPTRGAVPPARFIPVAESIGLIRELGGFVLRSACREAARWPETVNVAVNVSPTQFQSGDFFETVMEALREAAISPRRLELEITESLLMNADPATFACLQALRAAGVGVALDDFGTGYSSLSYLRKFPFTKIKIDRSFVAETQDHADAQAVVRAVVGLGSSLGMDVVAEGVERPEELDFLRREHCPAGQGYLFAKPMPASALAGYFAQPDRRTRVFPH